MEKTEVFQPQMYYCRKCYKETQSVDSECPQCGRKMQTQSQIKSLGGALVGIGVLISLGCGLGFLIVSALLFSGKSNDRDIALGFAALVWTGAGLAMGITSIVFGAWQRKHGRSSKIFVWIMLGLVGVMLVVGRFFSVLKD